MELLPCPFCGGEALPTAHLTYNWFAPVCRRCNVRGPSVKIERDSDPQEMRNLMNQADENWNLRASPASVPGWKLVPDVPTSTMVLAGEKALSEHDFLRMDSAYCAMLATAPTPPVSEDRKDAERYRVLKSGDFSVEKFVSSSYGWKFVPMEELDAAIDVAMQEDKS